MYFLILVVGALRIAQANVTKQTSGFMTGRNAYLHFGMYFEFAAAFFAFLSLLVTGFHGFDSLLVICSVITACCFFLELMISMECMRLAPIVLCNMCSMGGYIILPCIFSIFLFDEPMSLLKWLGVAIFFAAAYFLSPAGSEKGKQALTPKALLFLVLCFLANGACGIISKYYAFHAQVNNGALYAFVAYIVASLIYTVAFFGHTLRKAQPTAAENPFRAVKPLPKKLYILGAVLGTIGMSLTALNAFLSKSVPVVILNSVPSAISIIGCLFTGYLFYKEKISWKNALGVVCGIASILLIIWQQSLWR